ncbi:MAG: PTS sugar transporter subunit IIA [Anaerostipes sp.]|jgi:PTS system galactitol-specific IIA component|nr:PTS sugar transporter subunit IIA [Anaerostipes sp.]MDD3745781.1 PTS sugar transporter subunit IIA [Anaerostipes sp.]MDD4370015.1 PTS sugar transporter subunit IIA [Anaerostipes sp.]
MSSKNIYLVTEGSAKNWEEAIRLCGKCMQENGSVKNQFTEDCITREKEYPTGLPATVPVAIPHSKAHGINENCICFLRLNQPVRFYRMDDSEEYVDTRLVFNLAIQQADDHLEFLQKLMQLVLNEAILSKCLELPLDEIPALLEENLDK